MKSNWLVEYILGNGKKIYRNCLNGAYGYTGQHYVLSVETSAAQEDWNDWNSRKQSKTAKTLYDF